MEHGTEAKNKADLATGSHWAIRIVDVASISSFFALQIWLGYRLSAHHPLALWPMFSLTILAYVFADFISGLFHWMGDTWGSPNTPFAGKVFVRAFREHHVDQLSITRHDFIEVNGANSLISLPVLTSTHFLPLETMWGRYAAFFLATFLLGIFCTNQFHKWAHLEHRPAWIEFLQRSRLILSYEHHQTHHQAPYTRYYCITSGWMNEPLYRSHFFPFLERVISGLTGMVPRKDDADWLGIAPAKSDVAAAADLTREKIIASPR
jgi:ubiquitin-conjugating enzyme E2 variant